MTKSLQEHVKTLKIHYLTEWVLKCCKKFKNHIALQILEMVHKIQRDTLHCFMRGSVCVSFIRLSGTTALWSIEVPPMHGLLCT